MGIGQGMRVEATLVANEFIDRYMAGANGEYVKVYLYLLRHQGESVCLDDIAEALNDTEADVKRALAYWKRLGVLADADGEARETGALRQAGTGGTDGGKDAEGAQRVSAGTMARLEEDAEFSQLLYIAQRYMNKIFTSREMEVFAYLYGELSLSFELLEYLVEYCAQNGHANIRYIETVALDWHRRGLLTAEAAKDYTAGFTKNAAAVMKAFGLSGRGPGAQEKAAIERWFSEYGFCRELVIEACNRTMEATHSPSFRYAEKILSDWRAAGVKTPADVAAQDEKRKKRPRQGSRAAQQKKNQFHNFEQRMTDYDALELEQARKWVSGD